MQFRDEVVAIKRDRLKDALDRGYEDVAAGRRPVVVPRPFLA